MKNKSQFRPNTKLKIHFALFWFWIKCRKWKIWGFYISVVYAWCSLLRIHQMWFLSHLISDALKCMCFKQRARHWTWSYFAFTDFCRAAQQDSRLPWPSGVTETAYVKPDIETALFFVADVNWTQDKPTGIVKQRNSFELKVINWELAVNLKRKDPRFALWYIYDMKWRIRCIAWIIIIYI